MAFHIASLAVVVSFEWWMLRYQLAYRWFQMSPYTSHFGTETGDSLRRKMVCAPTSDFDGPEDA
eukprot:6358658-Amphidinium_carterae.1